MGIQMRLWIVAGLAGAVLMGAGPTVAAGAGEQPRETTAPQPRTGGREADLRPKFRLGDDLRYVMTLENDGATEMPGIESSKQTSNQQIEFHLKTISTDPEKGSTVELVYDSLKIHIDAGENKFEYDSKKPAGGKPSAPANRRSPAKGPANSSPADADPDASAAMIEALKPLIGTKMTLTVAPDGTITSVTGGQEISSALVGQYAGPIIDPQGVKDLFGPIFSVRSAKTSASMGEKWQHVDRLDLSLLGKLRLTTDHTLRSLSGSKATVDFRGQIELDTESGLEDQAFKLKDTRYEGSYIWDIEAGALDSMHQVQAFTLAGDMAGSSVSIKNNGRVKIERQRR